MDGVALMAGAATTRNPARGADPFGLRAKPVDDDSIAGMKKIATPFTSPRYIGRTELNGQRVGRLPPFRARSCRRAA